jgi:hypothetical protein
MGAFEESLQLTIVAGRLWADVTVSDPEWMRNPMSGKRRFRVRIAIREGAPPRGQKTVKESSRPIDGSLADPEARDAVLGFVKDAVGQVLSAPSFAGAVLSQYETQLRSHPERLATARHNWALALGVSVVVSRTAVEMESITRWRVSGIMGPAIVVVSAKQRRALEAIVARSSESAGLVRRARVILLSAGGVAPSGSRCGLISRARRCRGSVAGFSMRHQWAGRAS